MGRRLLRPLLALLRLTLRLGVGAVLGGHAGLVVGGGAVHENKRAQSGDQHAAAGQAAGGGREWQEGARRGVRECAWMTCAVDSVGASRTVCGGAKTTSGGERGMEEEEEEGRREEKRARPLAIGINLDLRVSCSHH